MACMKIKPYRLQEPFRDDTQNRQTLRAALASSPYQQILNIIHNVDINTHDH